MWQFDDTTKYVCLGDFEYPRAMAWGSSNSNDPDSKRREYIRDHAATKISQTRINEVKQQVKWWAFRIFIEKKLTGQQRFDTENAAKLVVDAFSRDRIQADQSRYGYLALFEDDIRDSRQSDCYYGQTIQYGPNKSRDFWVISILKWLHNEPQYRLLAYPMSELEAYFQHLEKGEKPNINEKTAYIFAFFITKKLDELKDVAKEIDEEYAQ